MKRLSIAVTVALSALALSACTKGTQAGSLQGRVLASDGHPVAGARVMLDAKTGRSTLTNAHGDFRLTGAPAGAHEVLARANTSAGAIHAQVAGNSVVDVGDVTIVDCTILVAAGGTGSGTPTGAPTPVSGDTSPNGDSGAAADACQWDPPPPPPAHINFDSLHADYADGYADPSGFWGYAWDSAQNVGFDFYITGDFTGGLSQTLHVDSSSANPMAMETSMFLWTGDGYAYVLTSGDLTLATDQSAPPPTPVPSDPTPMGTPNAGGGSTGPVGPPVMVDGSLHFVFSASNLSFDYLSWDGTIDPAHTASVGTANADGYAWVYIPPPPPTADVTIANFTADWTSIYLCTGCDVDGVGNVIYLYAYDSVDQADLSLYLPVSSLALPGTATVATDATGRVYGSATKYTDAGGSWYYDLSSIDLTATAAAIASGDSLTLGIANGSFDYVDVNGTPVPLANAATASTAFHLYITAGSLSGTVDGDCGVTPGGDPSTGNGGGGVVTVAGHPM